jgi:hypothetical protein
MRDETHRLHVSFSSNEKRMRVIETCHRLAVSNIFSLSLSLSLFYLSLFVCMLHFIERRVITMAVDRSTSKNKSKRNLFRRFKDRFLNTSTRNISVQVHRHSSVTPAHKIKPYRRSSIFTSNHRCVTPEPSTHTQRLQCRTFLHSYSPISMSWLRTRRHRCTFNSKATTTQLTDACLVSDSNVYI